MHSPFEFQGPANRIELAVEIMRWVDQGDDRVRVIKDLQLSVQECGAEITRLRAIVKAHAENVQILENKIEDDEGKVEHFEKLLRQKDEAVQELLGEKSEYEKTIEDLKEKCEEYRTEPKPLPYHDQKIISLEQAVTDFKNSYLAERDRADALQAKKFPKYTKLVLPTEEFKQIIMKSGIDLTKDFSGLNYQIVLTETMELK